MMVGGGGGRACAGSGDGLATVLFFPSGIELESDNGEKSEKGEDKGGEKRNNQNHLNVVELLHLFLPPL